MWLGFVDSGVSFLVFVFAFAYCVLWFVVSEFRGVLFLFCLDWLF